MEKLSMCRICLLSEDIRLHSIVNTNLQEIYEYLTMMPFVTEDNIPILACDLCCVKLDNTYELRRRCLQSEELFTQLLKSNVQVNLQIMPDMHLSMEDVPKMTPIIFDSDETKQEDAEDNFIKMSEDRYVNVIPTARLKKESVPPVDIDAVHCRLCSKGFASEMALRNHARMEHMDAYAREDPAAWTLILDKPQVNLQTMPAMLLSVEDVLQITPNAFDSDEVKQEAPEDARDDSSASVDSEDDTGTCSMIKTEPEVEYVVRINFEEDPLEGDDNIQSSVSEDTISLAVVKEEQSDVTASVPEKPRLDAQKNREDKPSKTLKRSDQSKDKIEEPNSKTKEAVEDKPVKKNKRVETCGKLDMKLHNNKQNNSTSDHNDVHKEIFANNIRAHPSVDSNSSNELKQFVCDTCQKCFRCKWVLIGHTRTHTGEKPYQCNVCKKCFIQKVSLNNHIRTHTGEKPYQCNICKKYFSHKCNLYRHIRTHTGEKPYQCNVCKKCFYRKIHLDNHIRIHTREKPYQCNECKKGFTQKTHLNTHIRIHSDEKPYQCNKCKKRYKRKSELNYHILIHIV